MSAETITFIMAVLLLFASYGVSAFLWPEWWQQIAVRTAQSSFTLWLFRLFGLALSAFALFHLLNEHSTREILWLAPGLLLLFGARPIQRLFVAQYSSSFYLDGTRFGGLVIFSAAFITGFLIILNHSRYVAQVVRFIGLS